MKSTSIRRGVVLSDAHFLGGQWLNCRDSLSSKDLDGLCEGADIAVLNGDTFDPHGSKMPLGMWKGKAAATLIGWLKRYDKCEFHYVFGNHDDYAPWFKKLKEISDIYPGRLHLHEEEWRTGNALFLHGDYARNKTLQWEDRRDMKPRKAMKRRLQREHDHNGNGSSASHTSHEIELNRLINALGSKHKLDNVKHLFAAHFHRPAVNYGCETLPELLYHNTGSPVRGGQFTPLFFDMDAAGNVSRVRDALLFPGLPGSPIARIGL